MKVRRIRILPLLLAAALLTPLAAGSASAQTTDIQRCRSAKFKLLSKYRGCVWKAYATAEAKGVAVDFTACVSKLDEAWTKSNDQLGEACATTSAASIRALFDGPVAAVQDALVVTPPPVCGDGIVEQGEECEESSAYDCAEWGFGGAGAVTCSSSCLYDFSSCSSACDLLTGAGCPTTPVGDPLACYSINSGKNFCAWPRNLDTWYGNVGQPCAAMVDCDPLLGCFGSDIGFMCMPYCDLHAPSCPYEWTCHPQFPPGSPDENVGLCR